MSTKIALILGSGPRLGAGIAKAFAAEGYKVAIVSRKEQTLDAGIVHITGDLSKPADIPSIFAKAKSAMGAAPNVVVYNAAALTPPPEDDLFGLTAEQFANDLNVNTVSAWAAGQEAVKGWKTLSEGGKTFIYTGNGLNTTVWPALFLTLGVGKSASAYWVGTADAAAKETGGRFFYADERQPDGQLGGKTISGEAHGEFYTQLAKDGVDIPWQATFVKGKGYTKF